MDSPERTQQITILMADDDEDDRLLAREVLTESRLANDFRTVKNGDELMDYLYRRGSYAGPGAAPWPGLILLDLNMPKKDGLEVLEEIKDDPGLQSIPIIVLTVSSAVEDILYSRELGASSYITKPVTLEGLVRVLRVLKNYWFQIVAAVPEGPD